LAVASKITTAVKECTASQAESKENGAEWELRKSGDGTARISELK
jgi:hypothetical protein